MTDTALTELSSPQLLSYRYQLRQMSLLNMAVCFANCGYISKAIYLFRIVSHKQFILVAKYNIAVLYLVLLGLKQYTKLNECDDVTNFMTHEITIVNQYKEHPPGDSEDDYGTKAQRAKTKINIGVPLELDSPARVHSRPDSQ
jgi:hypothetical protein